MDLVYGCGLRLLPLRRTVGPGIRLKYAASFDCCAAQRRYLTPRRTDELLSGRVDGLTGFDELSSIPTARSPENGPWGYTQIVHRSMFERLRYPETFNHFAYGDGHFIEMCKSRGLVPEQVPGMVCLHLDHPFAWYGSSEFL